MTIYKNLILVNSLFLISNVVFAIEPLKPVRQTANLVQYQASVHPNEPTLIFKLQGNDLDKLSAQILKIEIEQSGKPFQTINQIKANSPFADMFLADVNFDGYKDLMLQSFVPAGGNRPFFYWLYDPKAKQFTRNKELEKIISIEIDEQRQELISHESESANTFHRLFYKWQNGGLIHDYKQSITCVDEILCRTDYWSLNNGQWEHTLSKRTFEDEHRVGQDLNALAHAKRQCQAQHLESVKDGKTQTMIKANQDYTACLANILTKAAETFYPFELFQPDAKTFFKQWIDQTYAVYEKFNYCPNQSPKECLYLPQLFAAQSTSGATEKMIESMVDTIGASLENFRTEAWYAIWTGIPESEYYDEAE